MSPVNAEIWRTLTAGDGDDFWCFNNGVTVVAQEASIMGRRLILKNPQVVNGLQTSNEVFKYFADGNGSTGDERSVLVRVVVPSAEATRDRIIRATNSQTQLPPGALRATDPLQINLEEWLNRRGYYYERRANSYRNLGIAHDHIIGMTELARRFAAVGLAAPHDALSRADSLLEDSQMYARIFSDAYDMEGYVRVLDLFEQTDGFLRNLQESRVLRGESIEPWRYHYAYAVSAFLLKSVEPLPRRSSLLDVDAITTPRARRLFDVVKEAMESAIHARVGTGLHEIARSPEFTRRLGGALRRVLERKSIQ